MIKKILKSFDDQHLTPISGLDAAFLYAETPTSPMHVGSVVILEGSLKFETFKKVIESKLHQLPRLRQRLMYVPMSVDYPYWTDDPNFNIDLHLKHVALPQPGGWSQLRELASSEFSEHLDKSRPLWSFTFVEGLNEIAQVPKGSVAVISKIHHSAIDGMAGTGMLALLFEMSPKPEKLPKPRPYHPQKLPSDVDLVMTSTVNFAKNPLRLPKILGRTAIATVKAGMVSRAQKLELPTAPFTAPKTPMNGIVSAKRKWNTTILDLSRVINLKRIMKTTVNDVVLSICAGALRRYLLEKDQLPSKPLVSMVPISTRSASDSSNEGNQVSNMLVQLATDIDDPIERLMSIHDNAMVGKTYQNAIGANALSDLAETVPFGVANLASRMYSRYNISQLHKPVFNLVITNVPGPRMPIYLQGHKMISAMGMAPILDGMGLIITVLSYNDIITISPTSCENSMPDIDKFTRYIRESANELEAHVLAHQKSSTEKKTIQEKPQSDVFMKYIRKYLKDHQDFLKPNAGNYQIHVTNPDAHWQLFFNDPPGTVRKGKMKSQPDVTLTVKDEHLLKIGLGKLSFQTAFIQGRIMVDGDMKMAMKLAKILSLIPDMSEK